MLSGHIGRIALFLHRSVLSRQTSCLQKVITFLLSQTLYKNAYIREKVSFAEMLAWYCGAAHREGRRVEEDHEEDQEEERGRRSIAQQEH